MSANDSPDDNAVQRGLWPRHYDVSGSVTFDWRANIYSDTPLDTITIGLEHVRAANSISIEYDGGRDGWVIRMDRTRDMGGWSATVEQNVEVAFIPAWLEEEKGPDV